MDFPYQASIEYVGHQRCGGAIVARNWILANAQCVSHPKVSCSVCSFHTVRVGTDSKDEGGSVHHVDKIVQHEGFHKKSRFLTRHDLALWHVKEPFEFDETCQPIELFEAGEKAALKATGNVTGFDYFDNLRVIEVTLVDQCGEYSARLNSTTEGTICAGQDDDEGRAPGWSDEGGPLVIDGRLGGVVSEVKDSTQQHYAPTVYTEVAYYRDWIDRHLQVEPPDICNV